MNPSPALPTQPVTLYRMALSGHCHRVQLFASLIGLPLTLFKRPVPADECISRAVTLFGVMDAELAATPFLAGSKPTLADVANYSYIAHAPEGNVSLAPYPHLRAWLARVEALPGFVPMTRSAVGLAAEGAA